MKLVHTRKIITSIFILVFLMSGPFLAVSADFEFDEGDDIKTGTGLGEANAQTVVINIISYVLSFLGLAFLCLLLYGGFAWLFAGGNEDKIKKAKGILRSAALGLLIVAASYGIAQFIFEAVITSTTTPAP